MACVLKRSLKCGESTEEGMGKVIRTVQKKVFVEIFASDLLLRLESREVEKQSGC